MKKKNTDAAISDSIGAKEGEKERERRRQSKQAANLRLVPLKLKTYFPHITLMIISLTLSNLHFQSLINFITRGKVKQRTHKNQLAQMLIAGGVYFEEQTLYQKFIF